MFTMESESERESEREREGMRENESGESARMKEKVMMGERGKWVCVCVCVSVRERGGRGSEREWEGKCEWKNGCENLSSVWSISAQMETFYSSFVSKVSSVLFSFMSHLFYLSEKQNKHFLHNFLVNLGCGTVPDWKRKKIPRILNAFYRLPLKLALKQQTTCIKVNYQVKIYKSSIMSDSIQP